MGNSTKKEKKKKRALCQCPKNACGDNNDEPCMNYPDGKSLFCKEHQNCTGSPLSGVEPSYIANKLNELYRYVKTHNCMSYALRGNFMNDDIMAQCASDNDCDSVNFEQPGAASEKRNAMRNEGLRTCPVVKELVKADVGVLDFKPTSFCEECPDGYSKVALVVDKGTDYHWYRQDNNGMWSHKDGSNPVKDFDSFKRKIFNPKQAGRDYGEDLNYEQFCGFFCVNREKEPNLGQGGKRKTRKRNRGSMWSWFGGNKRNSRKAINI
jgi:hypothetical protein